MKTEQSAGGVVVRKMKNIWHVLLMRDMNDNWTFPKGIIEDKEESKITAQREIFEEVGLNKLIFVKPLDSIEYVYRRNSLIHKTVHYFLFISKGTKLPVCQKEEGIKEAAFFTFEKAMKTIGYQITNRLLLIKARKILQTL